MSLLDDLNRIFEKTDAEVLASTLKWAHDRRQALEVMKASEEYKKCRDAWARHDMHMRVVGTKTMYAILSSGNYEAAMTKAVQATAASRNKKIEAKLLKAGVESIPDNSRVVTNDGFQCIFYAETVTGRVRVEIQVIVAGGYNIQCRHVRVLTKVSK